MICILDGLDQPKVKKKFLKVYLQFYKKGGENYVH